MQNDPVVIVGAARTPMGGLQGDFKSLAASALGAVAIKAGLPSSRDHRDGSVTPQTRDLLRGRICHKQGTVGIYRQSARLGTRR